MGMSSAGGGGGAGGGRRRHRRGAVMSEINVTPMVDVMLVLLIIFMVAAPLLTVSIPVDLPEARGGSSTKAETKQLIISVKKTGGTCNSSVELYLGESTIKLTELETTITAAKGAGGAELSKSIKVRADQAICYADMMRVLGRIHAAGFGAQIEIVPERES